MGRCLAQELPRLVRRRPDLSVAEAADELALAPNIASTLVGQLAEANVLISVSDPRDRDQQLRQDPGVMFPDDLDAVEDRMPPFFASNPPYPISLMPGWL
jgi:hypothetical protein